MRYTTPRLRLLLLVAVVVATLIATVASAAPCTSIYVGISVEYDGSSFHVEAWISPIEVSWQYFKSQCIPQNKDFYRSLLRDVVTFGLQVRGSVDASTYVDNEGERFVLTATLNKRNVGSYEESGDTARLVLFDFLYMYGYGYLDEVYISIPVEAYRVSPEPDCIDEWGGYYTYSWYPASVDEASGYRVVEFMLRTLRIYVDGLPSGYTVDVYVDGRYVGSAGSGGYVSVGLPFGEEEASVDVSPHEISVGDDTKYVADAPVSVSLDEGGSVTIVYRRYYRVRVSVEPSEASWIPVTVDGHDYNGGVDDFFEEGSEIYVSVPESMYSDLGAGRRVVYVFNGWSDGYMSSSRSIEVNGPVELQAYYYSRTQYLVEASADVPGVEVRGAGWYNAGEVAVLSAPERVERDGYLYVLAGWSTGDRGGSISVRVDGPVTVRALYEAYVKVSGEAGCGELEGAGYYRVGDTVTVRLRGLTGDGYCWTGSFYTRLRGWRVGDETYPASPEISFEAEEPVTVEPLFEGRYYKVSVGDEERIVPEGTVLPALEDRPLLGGLVVDRFKGYRRSDTGELLGRTPVVNDNMSLEPVYERDYTYLLVAVALVAALAAGFYVAASSRWPRPRAPVEKHAEPAYPVVSSVILGESGEEQVVEDREALEETEGVVEEAGEAGLEEQPTSAESVETGREGGVAAAETGKAERAVGEAVEAAAEEAGLPGVVDADAVLFMGPEEPEPLGEESLLGGYRCGYALGASRRTLLCERDGSRYVLKRVERDVEGGVAGKLLSIRVPGVEPYIAAGEGVLARRYIAGPSLQYLVDIERREALKVALSVARYVLELHKRGVVHGGVKPGNVFIEEGRVLLTDHGYWMLAERERTPFDPPEGPGSEAGDVYMVGALAYWLLTMEEPSEFRGDTLEGLGGLADVLGRCLSEDAGARPPLEEVIAALEEALSQV